MRRSVTAVVCGVVLAGSATAYAASRPAAEHVPGSVDHVRIAFRDSADNSHNKTVDLRGKKADRIIDLFNGLKREPKDAVHCLAMGTASTHVIFKGTNHKWVTTQSICTGVEVTRDGEALPTLVPTERWNNALAHYLGHSPTGA